VLFIFFNFQQYAYFVPLGSQAIALPLEKLPDRLVELLTPVLAMLTTK
jgi:hypothetical protein